jgi:hypothetical protein
MKYFIITQNTETSLHLLLLFIVNKNKPHILICISYIKIIILI